MMTSVTWTEFHFERFACDITESCIVGEKRQLWIMHSERISVHVERKADRLAKPHRCYCIAHTNKCTDWLVAVQM